MDIFNSIKGNKQPQVDIMIPKPIRLMPDNPLYIRALNEKLAEIDRKIAFTQKGSKERGYLITNRHKWRKKLKAFEVWNELPEEMQRQLLEQQK